jgi:hypothetical protein
MYTSKKINLVTLLGEDKEALSFEIALASLARLLMAAPLQELVQVLAEISCILHDKPWTEAECFLRARFCAKCYIPMISNKVLDQRIEPDTYEDLCASVTDQSKLILEIKSGRANDAVKTGEQQALIEKYIRLKSSKNKAKGVIQSLKQAGKLRNTGFSGEIFTGIVFYNLPFHDELNQLITQEFESTKEYAEYRNNPLNYSPIWMDVLAYELSLLAVHQGINFYDILKELSALPPSETRRAIVGIMQKAGLKISVQPLYSDEIKELQERYKKMLRSEVEGIAARSDIQTLKD